MLYGGASGPLRCGVFLSCLLFRAGGALALSSSAVCCRVVLCGFLSALWRPSSSACCLCFLFVAGALALSLRSCVFLICLLFAHASAILCSFEAKGFVLGDVVELNNENANVRPLADAQYANAGNPKP